MAATLSTRTAASTLNRSDLSTVIVNINNFVVLIANSPTGDGPKCDSGTSTSAVPR